MMNTIRTMLLVPALLLAGCVSMHQTTMPDGTVVKQPASLVAMQMAQSKVTDCRLSVLQALGKTPIDTSTEAGRMHSIILSMTNKNALSMCDEIVAKVAAEYNATDRAKLALQAGIVKGATFAVGGYMIGQALEGIAAAAGTRVNIKGNEVSSNGSGGGSGAGGGGAEGVAGAGSGGGAETGIQGDTNIAVNIDSQVQQAVGPASLAQPNLEQADLTSPVFGEGSAPHIDSSAHDDDTVGFAEGLF